MTELLQDTQRPVSTEETEDLLRRHGFTLGKWTVEPRRLCIASVQGERSLDPRLIDVLVALASRPGEVWTRDELLSSVWQGTFVHENSLSQAISRLRKALGDDRTAPRYIETISRSGYRLVATVQRLPMPQSMSVRGVPAAGLATPDLQGPEVSTPSIPTPGVPISDHTARPAIPNAPAHPRFRPSWALAPGLVALVLVFSFNRAPTSTPIAPAPQVQPELTLVGNQFGPRISPDGSHVAFAWRSPDAESWDLWIQPIGGDNPVRLTDHADPERLPTWSPDGRHLAFVRFSRERRSPDHRSPDAANCGIFTRPLLGGTEERLGGCRPGMRSLAWSPDGTTLAFDGFVDVAPPAMVPGPTPAGQRALFLLDLSSGATRQLTNPPEGILGDTGVRFSPDGERVAFEREINPYRHDIAVAQVTDGATRLLTSDRWGQVRGLDWTSDGTAVLFSSNRMGSFTLWKIPIEDGVLERLPIHDTWVTQPSVSRAGGRLIYRTFRDTVDIWQLPLGTDGLPAGEPIPRMPSSRSERQPTASPTGDAIAFLSDRSGSLELWSGRPDGTELMRHTDFGGPQPSSPAWSPDGRRLLFDAAITGQADLWIVDRQSRRPEQLTREASDERNGSFSRDGSHIYFASNRGGGWEIWSMPAAGGDAWQVTKGGGFFAQESLDGGTLYFARLKEPGIWRQPVGGGEAEWVLTDLDLSDWGSWAVAERGLYFLRRNAAGPHHGSTTISFAAFDGSAVRAVYTPGQQMPYLGRALSIAADGSRLLYASISHSDDEVMRVDLVGL